MADNDQVLEQLNKRFDTIEKNMATKQDIQRVEQNQAQTNERLGKLEDGQAQTNNSLAHLTTAVEAVTAGQKELQETVATKADVLTLGSKIKKKDKEQDDRLTALEEKEGLTNPHKN